MSTILDQLKSGNGLFTSLLNGKQYRGVGKEALAICAPHILKLDVQVFVNFSNSGVGKKN
jgi:hypothetical protein